MGDNAGDGSVGLYKQSHERVLKMYDELGELGMLVKVLKMAESKLADHSVRALFANKDDDGAMALQVAVTEFRVKVEDKAIAEHK